MNRIRELRVANNLTQAELAKMVNVGQNTISNWENGRTEVDQKNLETLKTFFNVSSDYLLGFSENSQSTQPIVPDVVKEGYWAFNRVEFEDLSQYEIDKLAEFSLLIKTLRKQT
ncbi:MAG: helix-turn-helix domain-containing protein [Defluviitaleaceae bacterium]|nr:helix-turn-helix domain-containing protein [Defluviitaleaceae bacterium]